MEESRRHGFALPSISSLIIFFILFVVTSSTKVGAYKNYTVGDTLGWYDNTEKSNIDYQKWTAGKTFSLGDFLIFNTNNNHSVIRTYNITTYKSCSYEDSVDNDTTQWSGDDPSNTSPHPVSVPVPLMKTGPTYFLSGDYDGDQCRNGMHFSINVTYGQGLPKSLKDPSDEAPGPVTPQAGDEESAPDTIVPASFDHPANVTDDSDIEQSGSVPLSVFAGLFGVQLHGILILMGLYCIF
ncbi:hypothetical protein LIER_01226 [Lithospermum erythrorhizon]|uniref:Phytocyanin domain-containing protein n=1 Tax=Lithospermum erythrorhizon TaxID=34254 RepID=A0AAV3NK44_LITER